MKKYFVYVDDNTTQPKERKGACHNTKTVSLWGLLNVWRWGLDSKENVSTGAKFMQWNDYYPRKEHRDMEHP